MNARLITADASKISGADFVNAILGEPPETIATLVGDLMIACRDNDVEEEARLRKRIEEMSLTEVREIEPGRIAA